MTSRYWLENRQRIRLATIDMIADLNPYAFATVGYKKLSYMCRSNAEAAEFLRAGIRKIALACDERYLQTDRVTIEVPLADRFNAFCFSEKRTSYPHVHMAFFGQSDAEERSRRVLFLLEHFPTADAVLDPADLALLRAAGRAPVHSRSDHVVKSSSPDASSHVGTIYDARGLAAYITKEMQSRDPEVCESSFLLSEFYSRRSLLAS